MRLVFIVDSSADTQFIKEQTFKYNYSARKAECGRINEQKREFVESRVVQYVLRVDLDARLKEMRCGAGYERGREEDEEVKENKKQRYA